MGDSWFGGLLNTVKHSLSNVSSDLKEFVDTISGDTNVVISNTVDAIKERAEREHAVGLAETTAATVHGVVDAIRATIDSDVLEKRRTTSQKSQPVFDRNEAQKVELRHARETFSTVPEDAADFRAWCSSFSLSEHKDVVTSLLSTDAVVRRYHAELVPSQTTYDVFWLRYFYRLHKTELGQQRRLDIVRKIAQTSSDDISFDNWDDDVEESKPTARAKSPIQSKVAPAGAASPAAPLPAALSPAPVKPTSVAAKKTAPQASSLSVVPDPFDTYFANQTPSKPKKKAEPTVHIAAPITPVAPHPVEDAPAVTASITEPTPRLIEASALTDEVTLTPEHASAASSASATHAAIVVEDHHPVVESPMLGDTAPSFVEEASSLPSVDAPPAEDAADCTSTQPIVSEAESEPAFEQPSSQMDVPSKEHFDVRPAATLAAIESSGWGEDDSDDIHSASQHTICLEPASPQVPQDGNQPEGEDVENHDSQPLPRGSDDSVQAMEERIRDHHGEVQGSAVTPQETSGAGTSGTSPANGCSGSESAESFVVLDSVKPKETSPEEGEADDWGSWDQCSWDKGPAAIIALSLSISGTVY